MKSKESLVRLKRFNVDEKRRQVGQIEAMIAEFEKMASDLAAQVAAEQKRTGIQDVEHFAFPTAARAAVQRRDNLKASADDLKAQLAAATTELAEATSELEKVEALLQRDAVDRSGETPQHQTAAGGH
ncbi:flagellar export protein FliJ [Bauldia sp.]|uniref:flagellar export protein FliJ n=1 Tax=Bauldia sp. TaxID=2575872 RepID=UPI003BA94011